MSCIAQHEMYHMTVLTSCNGVVEAVICNKCGWLIQKDRDGQWRIKGMFEQRRLMPQ